MAESDNIVAFDVKGLGSFTAYKEAPAKMFFLDRRVEIAKILGGRIELVKLETQMRTLRDSNDPADQEMAQALGMEVLRANAVVDMKALLVSAPKGFAIGKLTPREFDDLWAAMEAALKPFPTGNSTEAASASPNTSAGQ